MSADEVGPLVGLRFKFGKTKNLSRDASELISENEMHGVGKEIPKEETYNNYGDAARKIEIEIEAIEKHGAFIRIPFCRIPIDESLIEGRFVYTIKNKPLSAGYEKTDAYLDENRKLDARFCVKGFQELVEANAAAPTVQLQSIRIALAVITYRRWNFRAVDVSRAFPRSKPLERNTYVELPDGAGQEMWPGN